MARRWYIAILCFPFLLLIYDSELMGARCILLISLPLVFWVLLTNYALVNSNLYGILRCLVRGVDSSRFGWTVYDFETTNVEHYKSDKPLRIQSSKLFLSNGICVTLRITKCLVFRLWHFSMVSNFYW